MYYPENTKPYNVEMQVHVLSVLKLFNNESGSEQEKLAHFTGPHRLISFSSF